MSVCHSFTWKIFMANITLKFRSYSIAIFHCVPFQLSNLLNDLLQTSQGKLSELLCILMCLLSATFVGNFWSHWEQGNSFKWYLLTCSLKAKSFPYVFPHESQKEGLELSCNLTCLSNRLLLEKLSSVTPHVWQTELLFENLTMLINWFSCLKETFHDSSEQPNRNS